MYLSLYKDFDDIQYKLRVPFTIKYIKTMYTATNISELPSSPMRREFRLSPRCILTHSPSIAREDEILHHASLNGAMNSESNISRTQNSLDLGHTVHGR